MVEGEVIQEFAKMDQLGNMPIGLSLLTVDHEVL